MNLKAGLSGSDTGGNINIVAGFTTTKKEKEERIEGST